MAELEELLLIWDQAGERSYEVLQELRKYDEFLEYLNKEQIHHYIEELDDIKNCSEVLF